MLSKAAPAILGAAILTLSFQAVVAASVKVVETVPAAGSVIDSRHEEFSVRFDGLIDHRTSQLFITQGASIVKRLVPLHDAAPEVPLRLIAGVACRLLRTALVSPIAS